MSLLEFKFDITETLKCPIYKKGDYFELTGVAVKPPVKREICVFPIKIVADILNSLEGKAAESYGEEVIGKEFNCGGCTGIIKFVCSKKDDGWVVPQLRMMKELDAKRAMAENMTTLEGQLKDFALLSWLDESSLKDFATCATTETFEVGRTILKIDTPGRNLYLLLSGKVVLLGRHGETIGHLGKGEVFGEMSLMFDQPVNVTVKVVEAANALVLSATDFKHLLVKFPFMKMALARLMAKRLSQSIRPVPTGQVTGVHGRLAELSASELFQMIHENMKSGAVELALPGGTASVDFIDGEIVDSSYNVMKGKDAFYNIVMEQEGSFVFTTSLPAAEPAKRAPVGGFMSMLMEGLRLLDEKKSIASQE
nr:cyclic nucleotide-binding domain-containing protein [Desulfobulbaceae bacterium]